MYRVVKICQNKMGKTVNITTIIESIRTKDSPLAL